MAACGRVQAVRSVSNTSGPRSIAGGGGAPAVAVAPASVPATGMALTVRYRGSPTARARAHEASSSASPYRSRSPMMPWMARSRWIALTAESSATIATAPGPICSAWLRHQVTVRSVWATLCGG